MQLGAIVCWRSCMLIDAVIWSHEVLHQTHPIRIAEIRERRLPACDDD